MSYGFKTMVIFVGAPLEPIHVSLDAAVTSFSISPLLPEGMSIDATTGTITGTVSSVSTSGQEYTVTATYPGGSITTQFSFTIRESTEMSTGGFVACYWAGITECLVPSFNYFYKNSAQYCKMESKVDFSDTWESETGSVWPGLDYRFLDYFSAYMYGYFNVVAEGTYSMRLTSDDGSLMYLDDLTNVFINLDGCRPRSSSENSRVLSPGRHLFVISYMEFNEAAVLKLEYKIDGVIDTYTVADVNILKVGGRGPTFITYPFVSGFVNSDLVTYQPTMSSGGATSWTISPSLPSGITIDSTNGFISGRPVSPVNQVYTVTASGYSGSAETEVTIVITNAPVSGLYTKYYKITDASFCSYKALSGNQIDIKVIKVDEAINHPAQNPVIPWTGLTNDFSTNYYVVWEGYLYHDSIGDWGLRITCDDGCKLISLNNNELINHWGCHGMTSKDITRAISSVGYYYYKIEYQQSTTQGGMIFEWRQPGVGWTVVPSDKMYHSPPQYVSYNYEMAHYFVNVAIEENRPVFYAISTCSGFNVSPTLPAGLSINSASGVITGTPSTEINLGYYTVTCNSGSVQYKTTIAMDVFYVLPPSGLTLKQNGITVTSVTVIAFQAMADITVDTTGSTGTVTSYTITPSLPSGLSINAVTGTISGTPMVSLNTTVFAVSAINSGGSFFMSFSLTITGCQGTTNGEQWTGKYYTVTLLKGTATMTVQSEAGATLQCGTGQVNSATGDAVMETCSRSLTADYTNSFVVCMDSRITRNMYISCTDNTGCKYQISREDGYYYPVITVYEMEHPQPYVHTDPFAQIVTPVTEITLTPPEMIVYSGYPMDDCFVYPNGAYKSITVSPAIISGGLDPTNPVINGAVYGTGVKVYTITVESEAGSQTALLTLTFEECLEENGRAVYTFEKKTYSYSNEESYAVYDSDGNEEYYLSASLANTIYTAALCLKTDTYTVKMMDSYGDGWSYTESGAYLRVKDPNGVLIKEFTFLSTETDGKVKTDTFSVTVVEVSKVTWKCVLDSNPGKNWYDVTYDDSKWTEKVNGVVGTWSQETIYFRYTFDLPNSDQYPLLQFSVYYRDGLEVYLNGIRVYLRNLPSNPSHKTLASSQFDDYYQRMGTAPGYRLRDNKNVIAIASHRHSTTSGEILWKAYVVPLSGTCITRVDGGTIAKSSFFAQATESAEQAWDGLTTTSWIEHGLPAWTTYSYNYDRVEWINKIILGSAIRNPNNDPTLIHIYGSNDGATFELLYTINKKGIWSDRSQLKEWMMMDHLTSYGTYKVEISDTLNNEFLTGLSVIDLQSCKLVYCTKDGDWPGTYAGETVVIDCADGYIGERNRKCGDEQLQPSWGEADETECRSLNPPKNYAYIDFAIAVNVTQETLTTEGGAEEMRTVIATLFDILPRLIEAWKIKDVGTDSEMMNAVYFRVTAESDDAGRILRAVSNGLTSIGETLTENMVKHFPKNTKFEFYLKPMLSERKNLNAVSVTLIVILVLIIIVVVGIAGFYIWVRTKSRKTKNGAKQLRSGKVKAQHLEGSKDVRI